MTDYTLVQIDWVWLFLFITTLSLGVFGAWFREKSTRTSAWSAVLVQFLWLGWAGYCFALETYTKPLFHFHWIHHWSLDLTLNKLWILMGLLVVFSATNINALISKSAEVSFSQIKTTLLILAGLILCLTASAPWPAVFGWVLVSAGIILCLTEGLFQKKSGLLSRSWFVFWAMGTLLYASGLVLEEIQADEVGRYVLLFGTFCLFLNIPTPRSAVSSVFTRVWFQFTPWVAVFLMGITTHAVWMKAFVTYHLDLLHLSLVFVTAIALIRWCKQGFAFSLALGLFGLWNHFLIHSLDNDIFLQAQAACITLAYGFVLATIFPLWVQYATLAIVSFASFVFWSDGLTQAYHFWDGIYQALPLGQSLFYISSMLLVFVLWATVLKGRAQSQTKPDYVHAALFLALLGIQFRWAGEWDLGETARIVGIVVGGAVAVFICLKTFLEQSPELKWMSGTSKAVQRAQIFTHGWLGESYELLVIKISKVIETSILSPISKFQKEKVSTWTESLIHTAERVVGKILQGTELWKVSSTRTQVLISWLITLLISLIVVLE